MKKNLLLFGVLIALLGVTWLFQEKKMETAYTAELVKNRLYPEEVKQLTISGVAAEKVSGSWKSGEKLLSHNLYNLIVEKIRQIKKIKDVTGDAKHFFSEPVELTIDGDKILLGDMSLDRQGFYVSQNGRIMLAELEGSSRELTTDEKDIQGSKLNEFRGLISRSEKELLETQLFRFYPDLPKERVTLKVPGNLPFELDLKENSTTPPPFPGISPHEKLSDKFLSLLSQVTLKEEVPFVPFTDKLAEMTFVGGGKGVIWELWLRSKKSADAVLVDPVRKRLMVGGTLKIFFVQLQDYWDKKSIPSASFHSFSAETLTLTEGRLRTMVTLLNKEPLEFESSGFKVKKENMVALVSYALSLGPLDQSSRVSILSNSEKKQLLSETHLRLEIFGQELLFWVKAEELIIVNLSQGFKNHYPRTADSMGFQFKDVLE